MTIAYIYGHRTLILLTSASLVPGERCHRAMLLLLCLLDGELYTGYAASHVNPQG